MRPYLALDVESAAAVVLRVGQQSCCYAKQVAVMAVAALPAGGINVTLKALVRAAGAQLL